VIGFLRKRCTFLLALGIAATGAGIVCAAFLPTNWSRMEALAKEPQRLTLRELAANEPGDNPHVIVTDYVCGQGYVYEVPHLIGERAPGPDDTAPGRAWIPLFPKPPKGTPRSMPPGGRLHTLQTGAKNTTTSSGLGSPVP
jgi:hypothetical protein